MKKKTSLFLVCACMLTACGQSGPLYLPQTAPAKPPTQTTQTITPVGTTAQNQTVQAEQPYVNNTEVLKISKEPY